jgi:hypothetical protein
MKKRLVFCMFLLTVVFSGCVNAQSAWITDLDAATSDARVSGKDLLLVFTGSDWNDPSKSMATDVFTAEFFATGSKTYVLCNIDVVQDETLMEKSLIEKNYAIAAKYGVQALPYFVLQTSEGDVYAGTGPTETTGTPDGLFVYLESFAGAKEKMTALKTLIKASKGAERAVNIDKFIETVDPSMREKYADLIREVPLLDADGKAGLRGKYQLQVAYLDGFSLYQEQKTAEAGGIFLRLAEGGTLDAPQLQEAWYMCAYLYAMSKTADNALIIGWLEKAVAADPGNPGSAQIKATIEQIKATPAPGAQETAPKTDGPPAAE